MQDIKYFLEKKGIVLDTLSTNKKTGISSIAGREKYFVSIPFWECSLIGIAIHVPIPSITFVPLNKIRII